MNKQEVIDEIENLEGLTILDKTIYFDTEMIPKNATLSIVKELDNTQKAVLNEEEAEWLEQLKKARSFPDCLYVITRQGCYYGFEYYINRKQYKLPYGNDRKEDNERKNRLVNALIYGYEVEKEKLYTVKFSNEDFGKIYIGIIKAANKIGISTVPMNDECSKCYFTKSELEEFKFWDNPAFEIKEVTE